ncbi:hypothetical protein HYW43_03895 [Candidatus Daviesbacteria bacterium]|nr:hypothetical protein [Candidatus Daviesbacteria bacterium]
MNLQRLRVFFLFFLLLNLLFPSQADAYLDPGTGSYFFQILIAIVLGGIFTLKLFFKRIVRYLRNFLSKDANKKSSTK